MPTCRTTIVLLLLAVVPGLVRAQAEAPAGDDERIFRSLSTEQLEDLLRGQRVEFKRTSNATMPGTEYFDFKRGNFNFRLTSYSGKDLMLDTQFSRGVPLAQVNEWNKKAKFSRASLHQDKMGPFVILEYNLDLAGGFTRGTLKQYLAQFEHECAGFDRFLSSAAAPPAQEKLYLPVTDAVIEQVLKGLKVEYKKNAAPNGTTFYDFTLDGIALRLHNFGGKDLMIDAVFRKTSLEAINKYNVDRKFVRAVLYTTGGERSALETNLDCAAGVSEEMVRYFITVFVPEAKHFSKYLGEQT